MLVGPGQVRLILTPSQPWHFPKAPISALQAPPMFSTKLKSKTPDFLAPHYPAIKAIFKSGTKKSPLRNEQEPWGAIRTNPTQGRPTFKPCNHTL
jgi:hypothetical protein